VLEFNRAAVEERFAELERQFGADPVERVRQLNGICGIAPRLRDYNIPEDALDSLSAKAFEDGCHQLNPRPCSREDLLALYRAAW
jgi:alcohol dehydrogenase class IV